MNIIDKINNSEVRKNNKLKRILLECELYDELYNNVNNIENIENIELQKEKEKERLEFYK